MKKEIIFLLIGIVHLIFSGCESNSVSNSKDAESIMEINNKTVQDIWVIVRFVNSNMKYTEGYMHKSNVSLAIVP